MGVLSKPIPFGDYFLLEKINTGGMAEVYKAKTFGVEGFERIVAVKKILPSIAEDKEFISMFIDEAKISVQLTHANIAQIFDLGNIDGQYYIAMEYVPGRDLRVIYDRCVRTGEKLDVGAVCHIISKLCEGLDYAHNKRDSNGDPLGIIHRDISPQNVLISYEGECKLIDFGIAKAANKSSATQVGILKGKFSYMSPEQVAGKTKIDRRSDVFALGIVLFELLTLKRLFLGSSDFSTLEKIRKVEVSPPTLYNPNIPEELEDIVLKALEKDVTLRYQTANELQEALQRFMFHQNIYYTAKDLSEFCRRLFAQEIALEQKKTEFYRELTKEVLEQSRQGIEADDDTSFYDKQHVPKMSGVQYERISAEPAPKQAIYAELDDFEPPPGDNIVYSSKSSQSEDKLKELASVPVVIDANLPPPRKSMSIMDPVIVNKGRETIMSPPVQKKSSRKLFMTIIMMLLGVIMTLCVLWLMRDSFDTRTGLVNLVIQPEGVKIHLEIDGQPNATVSGEVKINGLSTRDKTRYRISADGFESMEGSFLATETSEEILLQLKPLMAELQIQVDLDMAEVYLNGRLLEGNRAFSIRDLSPGDHLILVRKEGFKTEERSIILRQGDQKRLAFKMRPAFASIRVMSEPWETTFTLRNRRTGEERKGKTGDIIDRLPIDDEYDVIIADGPDLNKHEWLPSPEGTLETRLFPLKHNPAGPPAQADTSATAVRPPTPQPASDVRADTTGRTTTRPVRPRDDADAAAGTTPPSAPAVAPTAPNPANANLPGFLQFSSKPPADVYVNDIKRGTTPLRLEFPAGNYTIRFVNEELGIDSTQSVTLGGGEVKRVARQ